MAIEFSCPHCQHQLRTADDKAGLSAKCPACSEIIWVPVAGQPAATGVGAPADDPAAVRDTGFDEELPRRRSQAEVLCPNCSAANLGSAGTCRFCGTSLVGAEGLDERTRYVARPPDAGEAISTAWTVYTSRFGLLFGAGLLLLPVSFLALMIAGMPTIILVLVLEKTDVIDQATAELIGPLSALPLVWLMMAALVIGVIKLHQNIASGNPAANIGDLFYGLGREGRRLIPGMILFIGIIGLSGLTLIGPMVLWLLLQLHVDQRMSIGDTLTHFYARMSQGFGVVILIGLIVFGIVFVNGVLIYPCCIGLLLYPFVQPFLQTLLAVAYLRWSGQRTAID